MNTKQLVTFMTNGVAFRLGESEFAAAMKALRVDYGMSTDQLVTFMNDGAAARLGAPEFDAAVKALFVDYGMSTEQLVTFMTGGTAARVQDEQFQVAMRKVIDSAGVPCAVRLFNGSSFNCRIVDVVDDFCALVKHCDSNGSGPQDVVTMLGHSK